MAQPRPRASLNTDDIVDAALDLISEVGVNKLSMRQLSTRLQASLGATYRHMPSKEALLELCGRALYERSWRPLTPGEDTLQWLHDQVMNVYDQLSLHPGMASYVVRHSQLASREFATHVRHSLHDVGFADDDIVTVGLVLTLFTAGALLSDFEHTVAQGLDNPKTLVSQGLTFILAGGGASSTRSPQPPPTQPATQPAAARRGSRTSIKPMHADENGSAHRTGRPQPR